MTYEIGKGLRTTVMVLSVLFVLIGIAVGLAYLDEYVEDISPVGAEYGPVNLLDKPVWFNSELDRRIKEAVGADQVVLDENTASVVGAKLQSVAWLYDVQARTMNDCVEIRTKYRKPLGFVKQSRKRYYTAWSRRRELPANKDIIVLDYLPISELPIVEIKGFAAGKVPAVGNIWNDDDIVAAMEILTLLAKMDELSTPDAPLLEEIASVEVSNFDVRKSSSSKKPHIVLYAMDGTPVNWGAGPGRSARYLEASDTEKMAALYQHYTQFGTIQGFKYIDLELRIPQRSIPRPGAE